MRPGNRWGLLLLVSLILPAGCVERKVRIRSEPKGGVVYLDGRRLGAAPAEEEFVWYGTRRITVFREGHQAAVREIPLRPPFYEIPPLDLICELLLPWTIPDLHEVTVVLEPAAEESVSDLLDRAEAYRRVE